MAKGIANGFPMAAVVTTPEIAATLAQRLHLNTFGGNPVACAAARATLQVIEDEGLQQNCLAVGTYLKAKLNRLADKHSIIGNVRGQVFRNLQLHLVFTIVLTLSCLNRDSCLE